MLVSALLSSSLRKIGALSSGETIETARQAEALSALQSMLRSWGALSVNVFASIKENITLIPTKSLYTWGTGGDINTARPNQVLGAYVLEGSGATGVTHPVDIISEGKYRTISVKGTTSRPFALFFHPSFPLAEVYLYPVPDLAEGLYLDSFKPFVETGSFGLTTDTLVFPAYYEEPLIYNLAIRLAPEYGKTASAEVVAIAKSSYTDMTILNSANQVEELYILTPASSPYGARYSINSDSYH
jgi:hypothetical protein